LGFGGSPPLQPVGGDDGPGPLVLKTTPPHTPMTLGRVAVAAVPAALCGLYLYWSQA
jgi:hypothetical protein